MTDTTAMRDELAMVCGWKWYDPMTIKYLGRGAWKRGAEERWDKHGHPFLDGDLTALAAVWPEGWQVEIEGPGRSRWSAWHAGATSKEGHWKSFHAPTEYAARLALTLEVLKAGKEADHD
jgi:hypothetical protein